MAVMADGLQALTEKEKQTLRLLLEGHDAKSMARHLDLSVHTINERLRDARRKLSVSTSKEAARLLRQREAVPQSLGDARFGDAPPPPIDQRSGQPSTKPPPPRAAWAIGGLAMIPFLVTLLALSMPGQPPQAGPQTPATPAASTREAVAPAKETAATRAASAWLALLDDARWQESWAATGQSFQSLNTVAAWQAASEQARVPLGRMLSRQLLSEADVPAPPKGYCMVRFRTDFENRRDAIETVSLDREGGNWKVVGVYIE